MHSSVQWEETLKDKEGKVNPIYALAWAPDSKQLVAAVGNRVGVYRGSSGELVKLLKGHDAQIYCLAYSRSGRHFASGSADKQVIIWTAALTGLVKYGHSDPIYSLAFNPVTHELLSGSGSDVALWAADRKETQKCKVHDKVLSCAFTADGQTLALGLQGGIVSIRDAARGRDSKDRTRKSAGGELALPELIRIERGHPVYTLCWLDTPDPETTPDLLAVGDWGQSLSLYRKDGRRSGREIPLGFDPLAVSFWDGGAYVLVAGSNKKAALYTLEGVHVVDLAAREQWAWGAAQRPDGAAIAAVGCNDGSLAVVALDLGLVSGLFESTYAARSAATVVAVSDLVSEAAVSIECGQPVLRVAVYTNRLAVQLQDRILLFHRTPGAHSYELAHTVTGQFPCMMLLVLAEALLLCHEASITLIGINGERLREWRFDAPIRYSKAAGGPPGAEGVLVGLKSGEALQLFVDRPFPLSLVRQGSPVRGLDLSRSRRRLALIDDANNCLIYDVETRELVATETNVTAAAWNAEAESLIAFSGPSGITTRVLGGVQQSHKATGTVLGFQGARLFLLDGANMRPQAVSLAAPVAGHIAARECKAAYDLCCLGVVEADWRAVGIAAAGALDLGLARKAFARVRDWRWLSLLDDLELKRKSGAEDGVLLGDMLAFQGRFGEAAQAFVRAGKPRLALDLLVDLGRHAEADALASQCNIPTSELVARKVSTVAVSGDWRAIVDLYLSMGDAAKAVASLLAAIEASGPPAMLTKSSSDLAAADASSSGGGGGGGGAGGGVVNEQLNRLAEAVRDLPKTEAPLIRDCAAVFVARGKPRHAVDAYTRLGDLGALVRLLVAESMWREAFAVARDAPAYAEEVYVPYAKFLTSKDRYDEAHDALLKCGKRDEASALLQQLTENAVTEGRLAAAARCYWRLSMDTLAQVHSEPAAVSADDRRLLKRFSVQYFKAELYHAFAMVKASVDEPFNSHLGSSDAVFNAARFLLARLDRGAVPQGISRVQTLVATARLGIELQAFALARTALESLDALVVPAKWSYALDHMALVLRGKGNDLPKLEALMSTCARCRTVNVLVPRNGCCAVCRHEMLHSFYSFETLALVEFALADGITAEEAMRLIATDSMRKVKRSGGASGEGGGGGGGGGGKWKQTDSGGVQTLSLDAAESSSGGASAAADPFASQMLRIRTADTYVPIVLDREGLASLSLSEVLVRRWPCPAMRPQFYRNMTPEHPIYLCRACNHFYHEEDFELHILAPEQCCPLCGTKLEDPHAAPDEGGADRLNDSTASARGD